MNNFVLSELQSVAGFDNHKFVTYIHDKDSGLRGFMAVHRFNKNHPSFGATRYWKYASEKDALIDALRLAKTMSYKAALAGLPGTGAKAVLIDGGASEEMKKKLFKEYARRVNYFSGRFVTGSDVGISRDDVINMRRISPHFVGIKVSPERFTALGLYHGIKVSLKHIYGSSSLKKRSFAIQGLGKIGSELLKLIYKESHEIFVTDIDNEKVDMVTKSFPKVKPVASNIIHKTKVDVFSPCALSNCIKYNNIHELSCKIILGGANNQLQDRKLSEILQKIGILYAPDYVVNAGGLISVYDEYENNNSQVGRLKRKVIRIGDILENILNESKRKEITPLEIADKKAEKIFNGN